MAMWGESHSCLPTTLKMLFQQKHMDTVQHVDTMDISKYIS